MHSILEKILEQKNQEVAAAKRQRPLLELQRLIENVPPSRDFKRALTGNGLSCIAELKKATPLRGVICEDYDPAALAKEFESGGVKALSVLTDEQFFMGSWDHLRLAKVSVSLPVLRKDFIIDEYQLYETRANGADAVLLIKNILRGGQVGKLIQLCQELGLGYIVECNRAEEVIHSLKVGAEVIGINNRNINDFSLSIETSMMLRPLIPGHVISVSESGIRSRQDVEKLSAAGYAAILVGESLMGARDKKLKLRELLGA